jgi:hypothetical protein
MAQLAFWLMISAAATTGLLAGASLDQSIKQLPARRRIGIEGYSAYSQAADLGNGILFYATLGIGSAVLAIAAAVVVQLGQLPLDVRVSATAAAVLSVLHSLVTMRAAPILFSQRQSQGLAPALVKIFDRFNRWQTARVALQVTNFAVLLWSLVELAAAT